MASCDTSIDSKDWIATANRRFMLENVPEPGAFEMEQAFQVALPVPKDLEPRFGAALRHLLRHPGSMVRPRLMSQVAAAYGIDATVANDLAIALEYFHTASLVFDDLPCMDNAIARRGAPCVHVPFGEAGAILAALALINRAYALTWKAIARCPRAAQPDAMDYLEKRLGVNGLLNGQSLDLNYSCLPHDRETTERIACGKTVSLIRLTLVLPAMVGGARRPELRLLERMAMCWGLGYQIVDDLKDLLQTSAESGKTPARDLHMDRPNIALAVGVPGAVARLSRLIGLGGRMLKRLLKMRPELAFLGNLRAELQSELSRVSDNACHFIGSMEK
jgi:geranylgeranyl diphosphate synthase, type II